MNIVIFGGAGFIGTNLVIELAKIKENNITVIDYNSRNFNFDNVKYIAPTSNYINILKNQNIVYYLISLITPISKNQNAIEDIKIATKIINDCIKAKVKKVIFISSGGAIYGEAKCPIKEITSLNPINNYGKTKKILETMFENSGLNYTIIRLANPYGPYQNPNVKLGIITTLLYSGINNKIITLYGDGSTVRDFIYIEDAVKGIIKIAENETKYKIYNLGSGDGITIKNIIKIIEKILNKKLNIVYLSPKKEVQTNFLDISRFNSNFKDFAFTPIEEGIQKYAFWICNNSN